MGFGAHKKRGMVNAATRVTIDGITFASRAECARYCTLKVLLDKGIIKELVHQPHYPIVINGVLVCKYIGDFRFVDEHGKTVVEDVKSSWTAKDPVYKLKKKLMLAVLGISIVEVDGKAKRGIGL